MTRTSAVAAAITVTLVAAAPADGLVTRSVAIRVQVSDQQDVGLVARGHWRARRHDQLVVYLSKSCVKTVKSAKKRYVVASDSNLKQGYDYFVATLGASVVKPRRGKVCLMLASSTGRAVAQARAPYRMP